MFSHPLDSRSFRRLVRDGQVVAQLACEAALLRMLSRSPSCVEYMKGDGFAETILLNHLKAAIAAAQAGGGGNAEDDDDGDDVDDDDEGGESDEEEEEEIVPTNAKRSRR